MNVGPDAFVLIRLTTTLHLPPNSDWIGPSVISEIRPLHDRALSDHLSYLQIFTEQQPSPAPTSSPRNRLTSAPHPTNNTV